jgi:hypothetical protein
MANAPTPAVAAYHGSKDATEATLRKLRRRFTLMAIVVLGIIVAATIIFFVKVDAKVSDIQAVQHHNAMVSNQRANCQDRAFNSILKDARLAFEGDRNAKDYARAVTKC